MSDPQSSIVQVKIYDREYTLRTSGDPERLNYLCQRLDKRMREVSEASGSVDTLKVAILTALSLAGDLMRVQEELQKMDEAVGRRAKEWVSTLDRFL